MNDRVSDIVTALYAFFSGFGLEAYPENMVPDEAALPYITYEIAVPTWESTVPLHATVYYRSSSLAGISAKVGEIDAEIDAAAVVPFEGGAIWISKDPSAKFAQYNAPPGDPALKSAYLSMLLQAVS